MESLEVVFVDIVFDSFFELSNGLVVINVDIAVLKRSEETFDGDIIDGPAFAVHGDINAVIFEYLGMFMTGVL